MGKHSGMPNVEEWLEKMGKTETEEQKREIVQKVKDKAYEASRLLTEDEFKENVEKVIG
jgi:isopropylmalate/homocitrate/citramalate synthase